MFHVKRAHASTRADHVASAGPGSDIAVARPCARVAHMQADERSKPTPRLPVTTPSRRSARHAVPRTSTARFTWNIVATPGRTDARVSVLRLGMDASRVESRLFHVQHRCRPTAPLTPLTAARCRPSRAVASCEAARGPGGLRTEHVRAVLRESSPDAQKPPPEQGQGRPAVVRGRRPRGRPESCPGRARRRARAPRPPRDGACGSPSARRRSPRRRDRPSSAAALHRCAPAWR